MKIILKTFFIYLLFQIVSVIFISYIDIPIASYVVFVLNIVQILLLLKIYYKTSIINNSITSLENIIRMFLLSLIIFIFYHLAEFGFSSFFIPNYKQDILINKNSIIRIAIIAPFLEEIICRGILLNQINKRRSFNIANIIQAFIFALLHFDLYIFIFCFFFGIIMGIVCKKLNVYCCILIHSLTNTLVLITMIFSIKLVEFSRITYLFMGLGFTPILLCFLSKLDNKRELIE